MQVMLDREFRKHVLQDFTSNVLQRVLQDGVLVAVERGTDRLHVVGWVVGHCAMRRRMSWRGKRHCVVTGSKRSSYAKRGRTVMRSDRCRSTKYHSVIRGPSGLVVRMCWSSACVMLTRTSA